MNEQELLTKMKAPSQVRHGIWRGGVMQIHFTRACDLGCFHCTQGSNLAGKPVLLTLEEIEQAAASLQGYFGVVGVFGGNPALHPQFDEACIILRRYFPYAQLGVWCNNPRGKGPTMRRTFNPAVSNLNVHTNMDAYHEFARDWPECQKHLKGSQDSEHSPWTKAMIDMDELPFPDGTLRENTAENRNELISDCDVNQKWSAMICKTQYGLRGFFCEIAGAMAMLSKTWPDVGMAVTPGWWRRSLEAFVEQIRISCHKCGMPMRQRGQLALGGQHEEVSATWQDTWKPKDKDRLVQLTSSAGPQVREHATDYIENGLCESKQ